MRVRKECWHRLMQYMHGNEDCHETCLRQRDGQEQDGIYTLVCLLHVAEFLNLYPSYEIIVATKLGNKTLSLSMGISIHLMGMNSYIGLFSVNLCLGKNTSVLRLSVRYVYI